ncbi:TetR/AcrR family transcriptional regulator [Pseudonocardia ailaonensis]|uniref:TetR/AcrR family transcriptional regulator n=1 Tax=Pseudonocardia ailaonensis TaxID=367279 RepID=UPI0031DF39B7
MLDKAMPRLADHDARRATIVEALWRVIRQAGIADVSVRTVAAEAGMSPTALRYYFPTQDALLTNAMRELVAVASLRVVPLLEAARDRRGVETMLAELLPVGEQGRADQQIYLAFAAHALAFPGLRGISEETGQGIRRLADRAVEIMIASGELRPDLDPERAAASIDALVQGLTFQGCARPALTSPAELRRTLAEHLDLLCRPPRECE